MIRVNKISKRFNGKIILRQVSFEAKEKENLVILGPTGTGKTVLLKIMIGLIPADEGEVYFDNHCIQDLGKKEIFELRKKVGFVFQSLALFDSMTVFENIALSLQEHSELKSSEITNKVNEIISIINMTGNENLYPRALSGGMKRLVSIGRALAFDPQYILYDEPTTGLDPNTAQHICHLINTLRDRQRKCSIIVTHDLDFAKMIADSILMLRAGEIFKPDHDFGRLYGK